MKYQVKQRIIETTLQAKKRNEDLISMLTDSISLDEYRHLAYEGITGTVWTKALQAALLEHEIVIIPPSDDIYIG